MEENWALTSPRRPVERRKDGRLPGFDLWWVTYREGLRPRPMRDRGKCEAIWRRHPDWEINSRWMVAKLRAQFEYRETMRARGEWVPAMKDAIRYLRHEAFREEIPDEI